MNQHGRAYRNGNETIVEIPGKDYLLSLPGVVCLNPDDKPEKRVYQKRFKNKKVYLPREYELAVANHLAFPDSFTVSMNGYSSISEQDCIQYGIKPGAYEEACAALFTSVLSGLRQTFSGTRLQVIDGASNMGVDRALLTVAKKLNIPTLGFSCPDFMFYVEDDDRPVYVAATKDDYGDLFIRSLDLLFCTGGREHALEQDVKASCLYGKRIHFIDILSQLSSHGMVPATVVDKNGKRRINNAAAAFGKNISFFSNADRSRQSYVSGDPWPDLFRNSLDIATGECRRRMSPERMFT